MSLPSKCNLVYVMFFFSSFRLFFRPEQSGLSKVEAAERTLRWECESVDMEKPQCVCF